MSSGLERVTVNLTPRARKSLERIVQRTGDNRTDAINRAIQVHDFLEEAWVEGASVYVERKPGGPMELVVML